MARSQPLPKSQLELRHLRSFAVLAQELHFSRAAQRLGISQPALSQQLRVMEGALGVQLLTRDGRTVALTPAGQRLLKVTQQTLRTLEGGLSELYRSSVRRKLRVGWPEYLNYGPLPQHVQTFATRHPEVELSMTEGYPYDLLPALQRGELDVALLLEPVSSPAHSFWPIHHEGVSVILPEHHPLAGQPCVHLAQLGGQPLFFHPEELAPGFNAYLRRLMHEHGVAPQVIIPQITSAFSFSLAVRLVSTGVGLNLIIASKAQIPWPGVVFRPLTQPTASVTVCAVALTALEADQEIGQLVASLQGGQSSDSVDVPFV